MAFRRFFPQPALVAATAVLLVGCAAKDTRPDITSDRSNQNTVDEPAKQAATVPATESQPIPATAITRQPDPVIEQEVEAPSSNRDDSAVAPASAEPVAATMPAPEPAEPGVDKPPAPPMPDAKIVRDAQAPVTQDITGHAEPANAAEEELDTTDNGEVTDDDSLASLAAGFSLEQLPINVKNTWIIKGEGHSCSLNTLTRILDDGQGETTVSMSLTAASWWLRTQSDIDPSYTGTGLTLDTGQYFDLEKVVKETSIEFVRQRQALIDALHDARLMTVSLGFWPTWPVTQARSTRFSVEHFPAAYALWQICDQQISAP